MFPHGTRMTDRPRRVTPVRTSSVPSQLRAMAAPAALRRRAAGAPAQCAGPLLPNDAWAPTSTRASSDWAAAPGARLGTAPARSIAKAIIARVRATMAEYTARLEYVARVRLIISVGPFFG